MCKECGCQYVNYEPGAGMTAKMGGSYYGGMKVINNMPKVPKIPARKKSK